MSSLLPDYADPQRLCALGKVYEGTVPLGQLSRLTPLLASTEGEAAFVLQFGVDPDGRPLVSVRADAVLVLQCQRCLGEVRVPVESASRLALVDGPDEAARLADDLDPLLVVDGRLGLRSLIEDELILAVPTAPLHEPDACPVSLAAVNAAGPRPAGDDGPASGPFAALAGLKRDTRHDDPE